MDSVSYVSSEEDKMKQAKLNNVITSLRDYVSCTTPDSTLQDFGTLEYEGTIRLGQVICGSRKPRAANVPIISDNNVFLGYLDENGNLTVSNTKQIDQPCSALSVGGMGFSSLCCNGITECHEKCNLSYNCSIETKTERNKFTTITTTCICDCCIIRENMQQCINLIYNGASCVGSGKTSFYRCGDSDEFIYAINCVSVGGSIKNWTSPTLITFNANNQSIDRKADNISFVNECLHCFYGSGYFATLCSCCNGLDFELTLNCTFVDTVTYATTDCVSIYERYV